MGTHSARRHSAHRRARDAWPARLVFTSLTVLQFALPAAAQTANPHWRPDGCQACHETAAPTAAQLGLKASPASAVCATCHGGGEASVCAHRPDIVVTSDRVTTIAEPLRPALSNGQVVCTTCHDMTPHCALDVKSRYRNKSFLRGGPFEERGEQCFLCHEESAYRKPSPHMQSGKDGEFREGTCTFCHGAVPQRDADGKWQPVQYASSGKLSAMCEGCHAVGPHPSGSVRGKSGWFHMAAPSDVYAARMEATVAAKGGRMPLDPQTGTITCVTCHDPHDQRVPGFAVASTPGTKARLRYEDPCGACHDK